jgi:hypothetical protein
MQRKQRIKPKKTDMGNALNATSAKITIEAMTYSLKYYISGERVYIMTIPDGYDLETVAIAQMYQTAFVRQNRAITVEDNKIYFQYTFKVKKPTKITLGVRLVESAKKGT